MTHSQRTYLIVGGTSGIGARVAERCEHSGASIVTISRSPASNEHLANRRKHVVWDVTSADVAPIKSELPEVLNGLVYCPGTINLKPFQSLSDDDFREDLEVNLMGAVRTIRVALPALRKSKLASIVLFSTVATTVGMNYHASVVAAKSAVEGLAVSLAAEFARAQIRVNVIAPSMTDTRLAEKLLNSDSKRENAADRHPLKRIGQPDDIASAVDYLLSADASWITGQIIGIDGGLGRLRPL